MVAAKKQQQMVAANVAVASVNGQNSRQQTGQIHAGDVAVAAVNGQKTGLQTDQTDAGDNQCTFVARTKKCSGNKTELNKWQTEFIGHYCGK